MAKYCIRYKPEEEERFGVSLPESLPKLFHCKCTTPELKSRGGVYHDVTFNWFIHRRETLTFEPHLYCTLGEEADAYALGAAEELFTEEELTLFKAYIDREHEETPLDIKSEDFYINDNIMGLGAIPVGGSTDFYMIYMEDRYDLPFKVMGYYDLRECKYTRKDKEKNREDG